ncbi:hypothetical protein VPNG_05404 [Cytospora leucostoma]|uniref:Uncharacterized protein n=1 Tax=Cytospora leucostoma TaxID=1230097 RepID=A0A423X4H6_9PEZI|nr:hypothetical protein VPNG_05404 [Cytospora leucostoma]
MAQLTAMVADPRHSIRRKPISPPGAEAVNQTSNSKLMENPSSPSQPLLAADRLTGVNKQRETTTATSTISDDDGVGRYLPPRPLRPLTNAQISLLVVELLVVLAMAIGGIKGLTMLPMLDIFSVPRLDQDCGGYNVPPVEKNLYINLQIVKNLSFARAKLLDLAWDIIIGQGGKFLHGWVLYRVVASQLTWMMEYSSVPHHFQLDLLFSTVSLSALWSTMRFLCAKRPARTIFPAVWFLLAISYVLAFSSIWSAATGYLNPSIPGYRMMDQSYVTIASESLTMCWPVNTERLGGVVPAVVPGPRLRDCYTSFEDLDWNAPNCELEDGTDDWKNLVAYYKTKESIQNFFSIAYSADVVNKSVDLKDWMHEYSPSGNGSLTGVMFYHYYDAQEMGDPAEADDNLEVEGLYRQLTGFQFAGVGQDPEAEQRTDSPWLNSTFQLDTSVNMSKWQSGWEDWRTLGLEPVPYNSTLWYNGSAITLDAPFLNLDADKTACSWYNGYPSLDLCLCYGNTLLSSDFRDNDKLICISEEGYVWGFSSVVTLIGIILEVCWILGCFGMLLDVHINSTLFRMNRPGSGLVRNILDVAGAVQRDLGEETGAYKDRELMKALERCPPVGYEVHDTDNKVGRIAIVSMPGSRNPRNRLKIESSSLYA